MPAKGVILLKVVLLFVAGSALSGCLGIFQQQVEKKNFNYLKGKHISAVIKGLKRNPDTIEDWNDYKRYIWRVCKTTGNTARSSRGDARYLKPEVRCCDIQFETDVNNIIWNFNGVDSCPVNIDSK